MAKSFCPYLGTLDENDTQGSPVDYPSFENHCLVADNDDALLLTEQATFCLASGHHYCPRYQSAAVTVYHAPEPAQAQQKNRLLLAAPAEPTNAPYAAPYAEVGPNTTWTTADLDDNDLADDDQSNRRLWGWVGAGIIFVSVFLCGAVFAAYTGWQMVNHRILGQTTARVSTFPPPVYVVMTATSTPQAMKVVILAPANSAPAANAPAVNAAAANEQPVTTTLPLAVTPTPVVITGQQVNAQPVDATPLPTLAPEQPVEQATAPVNLQVEVPTRRETPLFDLPTSTPLADAATPTPLPTNTPTPPQGTPVVQFSALEQEVFIHKCTGIHWHVQNVQSVYYENQAVQGDGSKEECIKERPVTYKLAVVFFDGSTKVYSTTVMPLFPTETPTATPSFTPEVIPTETWTPIPPTATPTPNLHYATTLSIDGGDQHSCAVGGSCEIGVLVTNSGDTSDNISLALVQSGGWSPQLCRLDGVCSDNSLPLNGMGPGNTAYAKLVLKIPADVAGQTLTYGLRSISNGSNGAVMSATVTVAVQAK